MPGAQSTQTAIFPLRVEGHGFDTESGPTAAHLVSPDGAVIIPYLTTAENIIYSLDGWWQKMPGASKVNSAATGASDAVMGIFDYWRQGTSGTAVQKRLIYAGDEIFKDDADGTWDSLKGSLETDKMPWCSFMNDEAILSSTSTTDVPQVYDQTSIANLAGTPPDFTVSAEHKDRLFAFGAIAAPSRLYFTALGNHEDWTGSGSGSIDIFNDDGSRITAIKSHNDELIVWKGPEHGSMFRLIGSSPTGADAFQLIPFLTGVGATNQQSLIDMGTDLAWWDHHGIHTLSATAQFGNYAPSFISAPFAGYFQDRLSHSRFDFVWGQNFVGHSMALWTVSRSGSSTNNLILGLDYRFRPARAFLWPAYAVASIGMVHDGTTGPGPIPWVGTYTGFVLRTDRTARNIAGTGYAARVEAPYLPFGHPFQTKQAVYGYAGFVPKGGTTWSASWARDHHTTQTETLSQSGGAVLDSFTLDTDTLGGGNIRHGFYPMNGRFKTLRLGWSQGVNQDGEDVDWEMHGGALELAILGIDRTETDG